MNQEGIPASREQELAEEFQEGLDPADPAVIAKHVATLEQRVAVLEAIIKSNSDILED